MVLAGEGDETGSPGRTSGCCGVDLVVAGQNLGVEAGSKKSKAAVLSRDSNNLAENEGLEVECEASRRISTDIENLRSQMDEDVKELGNCEENEQLRAEMDLKDKEMQCLMRKQNEELQAYKKQNQELQANYEKQNEELQAKYKKLIEELQAKYKKLIEELQAEYEKQKEELQAKYEKQNEEVQAKNVRLHKNIACTLENQIDAKKKQLRQLEGLYSTMEISLAQLEECKEIPDKSCDEDPNSKLEDQSSTGKSGVGRKADNEMLKKQKLEMEVAKLDAEIEIKTYKLGELLEGEKFVEDLCSATVWKSILANNELQDIRRELIRGLLEDFVHRDIGIKRMGEIEDERIFRAVCQRRYGDTEAGYRARSLACFWSKELKNPSWHPFKIVESDGRFKEVVDEEDTKLKYLQAEYGDDLCNAVTTALIEMNEYNPSGRFPVCELWNFREGRKATMKEVFEYLFSRCSRQQQKAERQTKYKKQIEELRAKHAGLHKNIADTLENQIDAKRKLLQQLEGMYSTKEFSSPKLEECKVISDKSCDEDPNSKLVDQSLAEKSDVGGKADDKTLKKLKFEVKKLDAEITIKMDKLGELLEGEKFSEELQDIRTELRWEGRKATMEEVLGYLLRKLREMRPKVKQNMV